MKSQKRHRTHFSYRPQQIESSTIGMPGNPASKPFQFVSETLLRRDYHHKLLFGAPMQATHNESCGLSIGIDIREYGTAKLNHNCFSHAATVHSSYSPQLELISSHSSTMGYERQTAMFKTQCRRLGYSVWEQESFDHFGQCGTLSLPYRAGISTWAHGPGCCGFFGPEPSATLDKCRRKAAHYR
jgi:hypothetical protein